MKRTILIFCFLAGLLWPFFVGATDEYDNDYCKDPVELQKWQKILEGNPNSDIHAALHALWVGLCVQVEMHSLTTERANRIFENFRWGVIESIQAENEQLEKEET